MKKALIGSVVAVLMFGMASVSYASVIVDFFSVSDAEITGRSVGSGVNTHNWGGLNWLVGNVNQTGGPVSSPTTNPLYFPNFGISQGLFKFDLSSIPAGATINNATVSVYVGFNAFSPVSSRITSVSLYQVTSAWTEMGVTYDTRPTWNTTPVSSMSIPAGTGSGGSIPFNGYINGNVTNLVGNWLDGDAQNFGLVTSDTYTANGLLRIYAHEAGGAGTSADPRLRVDYTLPPPSAATPEPASMVLLGMGLAGMVARKLYKKTI